MKFTALMGLSLTIVSGCSASTPALLPDVTSHPSPENAHKGIRHQRPASLFNGYTKRPVVEPEPWRRQNAEPSDWKSQSVEPEVSSEVERLKTGTTVGLVSPAGQHGYWVSLQLLREESA